MSNQQIHHSKGTVMGGPWQIRHRTQSGIDAGLVAQTAYNALYEIERQMSHFKVDSDLMRLNHAPVGEWVTVQKEMLTVLETARELRSFTSGAIDVTLGKTIENWGFGAKEIDDSHLVTLGNQAVKKSQNNEQLVDCGYEIEKTICESQQINKVRKTREVALNFSSIAKGFAVDFAAHCVGKLGVENFIIEAAGEIIVKGKRAQSMPWQIGLELPIPNKTLVYEKLALHDIALATSGNYRKYREIDGKHLSHTMSPDSCAPIDSDLLSVSILHEQCMYADALATALFVKGAGDGSQFANENGIAALFLVKDPKGVCEIRSEAWMQRISMCN